MTEEKIKIERKRIPRKDIRDIVIERKEAAEEKAEEIESAAEILASMTQKKKPSNLVEVFEIKYYEVDAKNKPDARLVLEQDVLESQDQIISIVGQSWGFDVKVKKFAARDYPD